MKIQASFYLYSDEEIAKARGTYRKVDNQSNMINKDTSIFDFLQRCAQMWVWVFFETKEALQQEIQATEWKAGRSSSGKVPQMGPAQPLGKVSACPALAGTVTSASI